MDVSLIGEFLTALQAVHGGVPIFVMLTAALGAAAVTIYALWRWALGKDKIIHDLHSTIATDLRQIQDETAELNGKLIDILIRARDGRA